MSLDHRLPDGTEWYLLRLDIARIGKTGFRHGHPDFFDWGKTFKNLSKAMKQVRSHEQDERMSRIEKMMARRRRERVLE